MLVRYILGRAGRGKTYRVFDEIKRTLSKTQTEKLILIVPEQFTLQAERDLIKHLQVPGIMRVEVLSFSRLAHNVFHEAGGITRIPINSQGKNMMLRKVVNEINDQLSIYQKTSKQQGFIEKFTELLCDLKKNNIYPEQLQESVENLNEGMMKEKLQDIFTIYNHFIEKTQGSYMDNEDTLQLLMEKMDQANFLSNTYIWIDGFSSFSVQSLDVIGKLMTIAKRVTLSLPLDTRPDCYDREVFHIPRQVFKKIRERAEINGIKEELLDLNLKENSYIDERIHHLEEQLYSYPYCQYREKVDNIQIFQGSNIYMEIEYMAAKIIELVREKNYRWRDIAVVCNDLETYGSVLKRALEENKIPYFLDQKRNIMNNPMIEFILSSLEAIIKGYPFGEVSRLLKTGFTPLKMEEVEVLENYLLRYGIQGRRWKEAFKWGDEEKLEELNKSREKLITPFMKMEKKLKGKHSFGEITKILYHYLEEVRLKEKLEQWIDQLRQQGLYDYVNENTQIWNIVMETFDQLVEILGEQQVTLREYYSVLQSGFSSFEIGIIPTTLDQVLVGQIQRTKSNDLKALFVLGINDGILPSGIEDQDILSNEEKLMLKQQGLDLATDHDTRSTQERYAIYSALSKPREYLWLSYPLANGEGKALRPSSLIDRVKKIFPKLREKNDGINSLKGNTQLVSTAQSTFKHLIENLRLYADGSPVEDLWWQVYGWYYQQSGWTHTRENILQGLFHTNQVEDIGAQRAKALYQYPIYTSVSRLEGFVNCPFAHFIKYGLKPRERQEYKIQAPDIGMVFHDSMSIFTQQLKKKNLDWREIDREISNEVMDQVIDEMIPLYGEGVFESTYRYKHLVQRLKRVSKRAIWTLTTHLKQGEFDLLGHEMTFGKNAPFPAIEIELSDGERIFIEGRIDRVDILEGEEEDYIKIIDYKSGNKEFSLSEVYHGLALQLIVYLDAVLQYKKASKDKPLKPAGIFYFKIDDPMIESQEKVIEKVEQQITRQLKMKGLVLKDVNIVRNMDRDINKHSHIIPVALSQKDEFYKNSSVLEEEGFFEVLDHCRTLIKEISEEMLRGNIKIHPVKQGNKTACEYCSYSSVCQFDPLFEDNEYHHIQKLESQEILQKIREKQGGRANGTMDR